MSNVTEDEVKCWLKTALKSENLSDFCVTLEGNTEKGDGYMGNILFVTVSSETEDHSERILHLALKCSKQSKEMREAMPVKAIFENEIHLYENVASIFTQFQKKKGMKPFSSLARFYGSHVSENTEVVVLANLKSQGYDLCDSKKPLPSSHLRLILQEYGKWHAISAAVQDQEPETYKQVVGGIRNVWRLFSEQTNVEAFFAPTIEEAYELLKSDLSAEIAEKLKNLKSQIETVMKVVIDRSDRFCVVTHGDCWNNNFMFKSEQDGLKVAMLDWQTAKVSSPILDLSYFIFACSSEEDLQNFDDLLRLYYESFSSSVRLLGSDPERIFPFSQLLEDLTYFGKYGVMLTVLAVKLALSDKEEAPDFGASVNGGFQNMFSFKNRDRDLLKRRMLYIIEHFASQGIL